MNFGKISAATIARTAVLLLALTNQVLSALGKPMLPIESQTVEQQLHLCSHSGRCRICPPEAEK